MVVFFKFNRWNHAPLSKHGAETPAGCAGRVRRVLADFRHSQPAGGFGGEFFGQAISNPPARRFEVGAIFNDRVVGAVDGVDLWCKHGVSGGVG